MQIVSSRDFRQNMGTYLDAINSGKKVVMKTRSRGSFRIVPVNEDGEIISTKEEIKEGIRESFRELRASLKGEHKFLTEEEFWNEVKRED
jgi:antitoxin (DNA-binding transcriptional repressor) of toxin-antitoxin stability system